MAEGVVASQLPGVAEDVKADGAGELLPEAALKVDGGEPLMILRSGICRGPWTRGWGVEEMVEVDEVIDGGGAQSLLLLCSLRGLTGQRGRCEGGWRQ